MGAAVRAAAAAGDRRALGAGRDRPVRARGARGQGARALARGVAAHAAATAVVRPDGAAADRRAGGGVRAGHAPGCLRARRRRAARLAGARRAMGTPLARRGALRRQQRPRREHGVRQRVAIPRLGGARAEREPSDRPLHPHAGGGRPAARGTAPRDRGRLPHCHGIPGARAQGARRARQGEAGLRPRRRAGGRVLEGVPRRERLVRAVPRPQVRSRLAGRVLRHRRHLPQHRHDGVGGDRGARARARGVAGRGRRAPGPIASARGCRARRVFVGRVAPGIGAAARAR